MPTTPNNPFAPGLTIRQALHERLAADLRAVIKEKQMAERKTALEKVRDEVLANLARLGSIQVGDDALRFEGTAFVLPKMMEGNIDGAVRYLKDWKEQQEAEFEYSRTFNYKPWDGAAAFDRAMHRMFGSSGIGKKTYGPFGMEFKPELRTVASGPGETIQVPWGRVAMSPLEAVFSLYANRDREKGQVFVLSVEAPRKYRAHIEAFFDVVQRELEDGSIYRGKAFTGGDDPEFIDTEAIDPERVVYSDDVKLQLDTNLWSLLRYSQAMRENRIPLKRSVLVEGPYGTGKSMAGMLTAKEAVENGWTFIINRPGKDKLEDTLKTAKMYSPAVVWFEDIDVVAEGSSTEQVSGLLDALDGITAKGVEVLAGFTTNYVDKIQKGVMRPGRLDAVIHIGELDDQGIEKLIRATLPAGLHGVIDYATVCPAYHGFLPAFVKEAADRATRYAITRGKGTPSPVNTDDLVNSANGLRPQLQLMNEAKEGVIKDPLQVAFERVIRESVNGTEVLDRDDDAMYKLSTEDA